MNKKIPEKAIMNNSHVNKLMQGLTTEDKKKTQQLKFILMKDMF